MGCWFYARRGKPGGLEATALPLPSIHILKEGCHSEINLPLSPLSTLALWLGEKQAKTPAAPNHFGNKLAYLQQSAEKFKTKGITENSGGCSE